MTPPRDPTTGMLIISYEMTLPPRTDLPDGMYLLKTTVLKHSTPPPTEVGLNLLTVHRGK